jgi:[citrate (pro-3S)-lyase] ligase
MFDFSSRVVTTLSTEERHDVARLLESRGLAFEDGADATVLVEDLSGVLSATASLYGNVIRMVAVNPDHQESGLSAVALSGILETARVSGISHLFVYTKPDMATRFASLGFRNIAETPDVSLLEMGEPGIGMYRRLLAQNLVTPPDGGVNGAVVVNCSPFTLGHKYLIERASKESDFLYVIVVEAELSDFSSENRLEMVRRGVSDIGNAKVIGSREYAVSAATFPTYFLRDRGSESVARQQARLDIDLFLRLYVPALKIGVRFAGTEPLSRVTGIYNEAMREILPSAGVKFREFERVNAGSGGVISASRVREMLGSGHTDGIGDYVPESTLDYLRGLGYRL